MKISAVLLARFMAWVEVADLNPHGQLFFPSLVEAVVSRYGFQKFPQKYEDFNEEKGIVFESGFYDGVQIEKVTIYTFAIVLDTRASTDDSERLFNNMMSWAAAEFKITYDPDMITRKAYISTLTFFSDIPFIIRCVSNPVRRACEVLSAHVDQQFGNELEYTPTNLVIGHDVLKRKYGLASFTIQRRNEAPFEENKYFSEAPLPTKFHIKMLEILETELQAEIENP